MAESEGGGFGGLFKEHPVVMAVSVVAVALIAYLSSRKSGGGSGTAVIANPAVDPNAGTNAAAITQANIAAGAANVNTAANLIGAESTNAANLRGALAGAEVGRQVGLSQIEASLLASENADAAQVTIAQGANAAQLEAARITAAAQTAANQATNGAVNNTPVVNNGGGTGVPTAIQWFGTNPPSAPKVGAGASIFGSLLPAGASMTADSSSAASAENAAHIGPITGTDIKNIWNKAVAYFTGGFI